MLFRSVAAPERSRLAPEVPTLEESGWKGIDMRTWHGLLGPAGLSADIVGRLHGAISRGMHAPEFRDKLARDGVDVVANSPAEFDAFIRSEIPRWAKVIRAVGVKLD